MTFHWASSIQPKSRPGTSITLEQRGRDREAAGAVSLCNRWLGSLVSALSSSTIYALPLGNGEANCVLEVKAPTRLSCISLLSSQAQALSHVTAPDSLPLVLSLLSLGLFSARRAVMSNIKRHALFRVIGQWRNGVLQLPFVHSAGTKSTLVFLLVLRL